MDRVFLDANVLFSAAYRDGAKLRKLWEVADARLITSQYAIAETKRNLKAAEALLRLDALLTAVEIVEEPPGAVYIGPSLGLPPKDVPIVQGAVTGKATHLLTGDKDFERLFGTTYEGVLVLRPGDYLRTQPVKE